MMQLVSRQIELDFEGTNGGSSNQKAGAPTPRTPKPRLGPRNSAGNLEIKAKPTYCRSS